MRGLKKTFPCCTVEESLVKVPPSDVLGFTETLPREREAKERKIQITVGRELCSHFLKTLWSSYL